MTYTQEEDADFLTVNTHAVTVRGFLFFLPSYFHPTSV